MAGTRLTFADLFFLDIGWQLPHSESSHRLMVMAMVVMVEMMVVVRKLMMVMVVVTVTLMVGLVVTRGG